MHEMLMYAYLVQEGTETKKPTILHNLHLINKSTTPLWQKHCMKAKSVHYCYQGYYYDFGLGDTNSSNWRLLAILRRSQSSRNQTQTSHINSMYSFSTQPSRREDRRLICAPSNSSNILTKYSSPQNSKNLLPHLSCTTLAKGGNSFQMSHKTCNIF